VLVPLAKVRIIGRSGDLDQALDALHRLRRVELAPADGGAASWSGGQGARVQDRHRDQLRLLIATLDALVGLRGDDLEHPGGDPQPAADAARVHGPAVDPRAVARDAVARELAALTPDVEALVGAVEVLRSEQAVLRRYVALLSGLLELAPELAMLEERELAALRLTTVALLLSSEGARVVELLDEALSEILGERFWLLSAPIDEDGIGCVLVHPQDDAEAVNRLLGQEHIRHVPLPEPYARLSLRTSVESMQRRLAELPAELGVAQTRLSEQIGPYVESWTAQRAALSAQLEQLDALALAGATERTFHLAGWTPRTDMAGVTSSLEGELGGRVVVEELAEGRADHDAPVLMRSSRAARPFQPLVRFFDTPRSRSVDPTGLMAIFLPLMFGLMVADVAYGAILLALVLVARARLSPRYPAFGQISPVLIAGALWAIAFGILFGEALGNAGERLGMPALWLRRDSSQAVVPLLVLAVSIGAVHVVLGLVLGIWQSHRDRDRRELLGHTGTLVFLAGAFLLAGIVAGLLPAAATTPIAAALVGGLVAVSVAGGALGAITGPLELLGAITNVLSYLRLAAVGLASVYLAVVANKLAGVGPIFMGILIAAFLHALNLMLATFTPSVQALRLHYVEFFGKFFLGGGRPFAPFGVPQPGSPSGVATGLSSSDMVRPASVRE